MEVKTLFLDNRIINVPLECIDIFCDGHRGDIPEERIISVAASIRKNGLIEPLFLRRNPDKDGYILVSGSVRYFALCFLRARCAPSVILSLTAAESELVCMVLDVNSQSLSEFERAEGIASLMKSGKFSKLELADALNTTVSEIDKILSLLYLTKKQRNFLTGRGFSTDFAYRLVGIKADKRQDIFNRILLSGLNEESAIRFIDGREEKPVGRVCGVISERLILNSVNSIAEKINNSGGNASVITNVGDGSTEYRLIVTAKL